jgi:hypothetical protein
MQVAIYIHASCRSILRGKKDSKPWLWGALQMGLFQTERTSEPLSLFLSDCLLFGGSSCSISCLEMTCIISVSGRFHLAGFILIINCQLNLFPLPGSTFFPSPFPVYDAFLRVSWKTTHHCNAAHRSTSQVLPTFSGTPERNPCIVSEPCAPRSTWQGSSLSASVPEADF